MLDQLNEASEHLYPAAEPQTAQTQELQVTTQESQKETSMRILRERAEAAERRSQELERMIQANMSQNQQHNKMNVVDNDDDNVTINDDAYVEGKQLKKYLNNMQKKLEQSQKQLEEFNQQNAMTQAEMRLKNQFNDFESVVNEENLKKLQSQKPALYRTILANSDIYDKGYTAYELIKHSGIISDQYEELDKKVEENRFKPRSAANASPQSSDTPLTRVGDYDRRILTEDRKDQLRRQVEEAKRNR